jgi:hypothetical protein
MENVSFGQEKYNLQIALFNGAETQKKTNEKTKPSPQYN